MSSIDLDSFLCDLRDDLRDEELDDIDYVDDGFSTMYCLDCREKVDTEPITEPVDCFVNDHSILNITKDSYGNIVIEKDSVITLLEFLMREELRE